MPLCPTFRFVQALNRLDGAQPHREGEPLPGSTRSPVNLIHKQLGSTQKQGLIRAPCGPFKLTHKINTYWGPLKQYIIVLGSKMKDPLGEKTQGL